MTTARVQGYTPRVGLVRVAIAFSIEDRDWWMRSMFRDPDWLHPRIYDRWYMAPNDPLFGVRLT